MAKITLADTPKSFLNQQISLLFLAKKFGKSLFRKCTLTDQTGCNNNISEYSHVQH